MPQPPQYIRITDFSTDEANSLSGRSTVRTANLDTELDNVKLTLDQLNTNIGLIQRDDGKLLDQVVSQASLSSAVTALFVAIGANPRGAWLTATVYAFKDIIETGSPIAPYMCVTAHTSGVFSTDYTAGRWVVIGSAQPIASQVTSTATGDVSATNVQSAIAELASEKVAKALNGSDFANISTVRDNLSVFSRTEGQTSSYLAATAAGTFDAITASFTPAITALTNGQVLYVRAIGANTVTNPTFTPNSGVVTAKTIKKLNNIVLNVGDINGSSHVLILQYNLTVDAWFLLNPAGLPSVFGDTTFFDKGIGPSYLQNLGVDATVSAKALTFSQLTKAGLTPTATDKVQIEHRDPTITTGRTITREATAATTLVVPSTATLGYAANETAYTHLYSIWSAAGGLEVACIKRAIINESELQSTTAISTASDSDNVLYSTSARTGATVRLIERIRIQSGAVAGEWDNQPTEKAVWTPSMKTTGDTIEYISATGSSGTTLSASATFTGVNVEVGDRLIINYSVTGTRNAADFAYLITIGELAGTSVFSYDGNSSLANLVFSGITAVTQPNGAGTFMFTCTTAGTVTTVGANAVALQGTAALALTSYVRAEVQRRQR